MIDELVALLRRELEALRRVENRLVALELLVTAGEVRFLSMAVDEASAAMDHLSALELSRGIALASVGGGPDLPLDRLVSSAPPELAPTMAQIAAGLRETAGRVAVRRERVRTLVESAAEDGRTRLRQFDGVPA